MLQPIHCLYKAVERADSRSLRLPARRSSAKIISGAMHYPHVGGAGAFGPRKKELSVCFGGKAAKTHRQLLWHV